MVIFAYDGSLNGDWVAHYAARFAANTRERRLRLVHVYEACPGEHLPERLARIAEECRVLGVDLALELVARGDVDVAERLIELVPSGETLIAGTRAKPRGYAFLAGTVSARLLDARRSSVIAIRVVHPGVLGQPDSVLLPLVGHPRGAASALPVLRLLGEDLRRLHVLVVREVSRLRSRVMSGAGVERLRTEGRAFLTRIEAELREGLSPHRFELDSTVAIAEDAPREIVLQASKHRARLICLGASERTRPERVVHGDPIEDVLRAAPSDVAVYRSIP